MPMPVKIIMDDLHFIADMLRESGRFDEAYGVDALESAANTAGHHVYTWDEVAAHVRDSIAAVTASHTLDEDVLELIHAALSKPRNL